MKNDNQLYTIQKLTLFLFASGALNIFLIAFVFFWVLHERPPTPYFEQMPKKAVFAKKVVASPTNAALLQSYKAKSFDELLPTLSKSGLVEDGFKERDLALSVLVGFHYFNLEKALGGLPEEKRLLSFDGGKQNVVVFPNLSDEQFETIQKFISLEKWPFKAQGLFLLLKKETLKDDLSLKQAFYLTEEFHSAHALFQRLDIPEDDVLAMLLEGDFGLLLTFYEGQKKVQDHSQEMREKLLLGYVKLGSRNAAKIILRTDFEFVLKRLSDSSVVQTIALLDKELEGEDRAQAIKFLKAVASSPRSDIARKSAKEKYEALSGSRFEPLVSREEVKKSEPIIPKVVSLAHPAPPKKEAAKTPKGTPPAIQRPGKLIASSEKESLPKKSAPEKQIVYYTVQDGDSLWKIAKRFNVSVEAIRSLNQLKSDALKPGVNLKVPDQSRPGAKGGSAKSA